LRVTGLQGGHTKQPPRLPVFGQHRKGVRIARDCASEAAMRVMLDSRGHEVGDNLRALHR